MMNSASKEMLALLDACRAAPADDTPRLILADWLEERGDNDLSALVRAQVELSHPTADKERVRQLKSLENDLFNRNWKDWLGEYYRIRGTSGRDAGSVTEINAVLNGEHPDIHFRRGLVTLKVGRETTKWEEVRDALKSHVAPWIECIEADYDDMYDFERCTYARSAAGRLNATITINPTMPRMQGNDLRGHPILISPGPTTPAKWRRFVQSSNFTTLQSLTIVGDDGTGLLRELGGDEASRLVGLHLDCQANLYEAATLAAEAPFHALSTLSIGRLNTAAIQILCRSEHFHNLQSLNPRDPKTTKPLPIGEIGDAGLIALCESPLAKTLNSIFLQNTGIGDDGISALVASPIFDRIHGPRLNLMMNRIGDRGLAAIAQSPCLLRFREIVLRENQVGDTGAAALAKSPYAANLAYLDFWRNRLNDYGAIALSESPYLNHVADISVKENFVTDDGMLALQERFGERAKG